MSADNTIEQRLIAAIIKDDTGERLAECRKLTADAFTDPKCARAWLALTRATSREAGAVHRDAREFFAHPTCGAEYPSDRDAVYIEWLKRMGLGNVEQWREALPTGSKDKVRARLVDRLFNFTTPPPEPVPRFLINDKAVCTAGNLTNLIAQAKAGKTAMTAAMLAAAICAEYGNSDRDTLGITATAPGAKRLLHFDTEQSPFDHDQHIRRALRRAGSDTLPPWLVSYSLAGFSAEDLRNVLRVALIDAEAAGGVFAVIIDGTADMVNDVNDAKECNPFVAELHALAIKHACPIINIVHENPGQDQGKMRGHLGSQLERKAESNLRLKKSDEITVIFSEKMRRAPILEKDGPRFKWSDEAGMHVSCESAGKTKEDAKRDALLDEVESAFREAKKEAMSWREMVALVGEKKLAKMKSVGVIRQEFGSYRLAA